MTSDQAPIRAVLRDGRARGRHKFSAMTKSNLVTIRYDKGARNVLGGELQPCSLDPLTGFYRNGCCETGPEDTGQHTVCAVMTRDFLAFSMSVGNDLSTPRPEYDFPGLGPGDHWCLCAPRWKEALDAGVAPPVILAATHEEVLAITPLGILKDNVAKV